MILPRRASQSVPKAGTVRQSEHDLVHPMKTRFHIYRNVRVVAIDRPVT